MSAKPENPPEVSYIVQVKDEAIPEDVAAALSEHGFQVERVLSTLGVIGGHGPSDLRKTIAELPGVGLVREEGMVQLPPFDERVPQ